MSSAIRLVALDLDGTLLTHQHEISSATRQALSLAAERGVTIVLATGRPLANLPPVAAQLEGIRYAITSNGAAVWDLGADPMAAVFSRYADAALRNTTEPICLCRSLLKPEDARQALELCLQSGGALGVFSDGRAFRSPEDMRRFAARMVSSSTEAHQPNDGRFIIVRDLAEWMSRHAHEIEKLCVFFDSIAETEAALPRFLALSGVQIVQGMPDNIEVTAAGTDKGEALLALAAHLGIPQSQTLAIGDSENDAAMLRKAGVAAVMANGMPSVKRLADIVSEADCDHDGVAEVLRRLEIV